MKNTLKLGALALVLTISFASCSGSKSTSTTDSTKTGLDTAAKPHPDTAKHDTTKMAGPDTATKKM